MKKVLFIFLLSIVWLLVPSCSDSFLELYPEANQVANEFYQTKDQFDQALNSAYRGLRDIAYYGMFMDEQRSDNAFFDRYMGDRGPFNCREKLALFIDDAVSANGTTHASIRERWIQDWANVARINAILDRVDNATEMVEADKLAVKAEASFLRAYYYFDLVKNWGGMPLNIHEIHAPNEAFIPRSSVEETYNQILSDLDTAISIGLPIPSNFPVDNGGRVTMGAAKMLRAEVNMTKPNPDYSIAEKDLKDITNMHYDLLSNYADCFDPSKKNMEETIFEVQYTEDGSSDQYSVFAYKMAPKCSNLEEMMGVGGTNYAGESGGWVVPTQKMIDSYEDGDLRLPASIAIVEGHSDGDLFYFEKLIHQPKGYVCPEGKDSRMMVIKYYHPPYAYSVRTKENFPIYRYAGALLLLSECLVQEGKNVEALSYINKVRRRAGLLDLTNCTLKDVANEQKHELAFENHRWSDLKREGMAKEVMTEYGKYIKESYPWVKATNNDGCFKIEDFRMIYAIPTRDIELFPGLEQNPGY